MSKRIMYTVVFVSDEEIGLINSSSLFHSPFYAEQYAEYCDMMFCEFKHHVKAVEVDSGTADAD